MCSDRQFKNTNSHFQCLEVDIFVPKIYCWNYEKKSYNVSEYFSFMPKTIPSSRVLETQNPETQNPEPRASELQMPFSYGVLNNITKDTNYAGLWTTQPHLHNFKFVCYQSFSHPYERLKEALSLPGVLLGLGAAPLASFSLLSLSSFRGRVSSGPLPETVRVRFG